MFSRIKGNKDATRLNTQYLDYIKSNSQNQAGSKDFQRYVKEDYFEPIKSMSGLGLEYQKLTVMGYLIRCSEEAEIQDTSGLTTEMLKILKSDKPKYEKLAKLEEYFELHTDTVLLDDSISPFMIEDVQSMNTYLGRVVEAELPHMTTYKLVDVIGTNWNQIKRELITMWQIVKQVREESTVTV